MKRALLTVFILCIAFCGTAAIAEVPSNDTLATPEQAAAVVVQQTVAEAVSAEPAPAVEKGQVSTPASNEPSFLQGLEDLEPAAMGGMCHHPTCMLSCAPQIGECCDGVCICSDWGLVCH